jgi:hypothetical protein
VQDMTGDQMNALMHDKCYPADDYHTMFFGEIVECYRTDD